MKRSWELVDVTVVAKEAPYTYYIPSASVMNRLKSNDFVKLTFACDIENDKGWSAERMWVEITERTGEMFKGLLRNEPYYIPDLKFGEEIEFSVCNISQTSLDDAEPNLVDQYSERCYVTNSVLLDGNPVLQLFREEPENEEGDYSGWNFFSGLENDGYLDHSENWNYVSIGSVLNIDDSFIELLDAEYGTEYVWDSEVGKHVKI